MTNLEIYHAGIRAFTSGMKRYNNPYDADWDPDKWQDWDEGWEYAENVKAGMEHDYEIRKNRA
jgi:hypothetical protein